ncbi:hypothetical protein NM43_2064 [Neisseria meningitidis NM43]|nr:hypothetical protein NM43_2064 [Neisseria meningitidis NM43]EOC23690.1 hypothetical protein NM2001072_2102 [Neisseria meningitidis 2001072]
MDIGSFIINRTAVSHRRNGFRENIFGFRRHFDIPFPDNRPTFRNQARNPRLRRNRCLVRFFQIDGNAAAGIADGCAV